MRAGRPFWARTVRSKFRSTASKMRWWSSTSSPRSFRNSSELAKGLLFRARATTPSLAGGNTRLRPHRPKWERIIGLGSRRDKRGSNLYVFNFRAYRRIKLKRYRFDPVLAAEEAADEVARLGDPEKAGRQEEDGQPERAARDDAARGG